MGGTRQGGGAAILPLHSNSSGLKIILKKVGRQGKFGNSDEGEGDYNCVTITGPFKAPGGH